jgi:lysozyme family protein
MSAACYSQAIGRLLKSEGGYVNHPSDPGGPTNFGITLADYRKYKKPGATAADVRRMKVSEARDIYRGKYWNAIRGDDLPAGVDYCLFDYAVNSGTGRAPKVLQRVLGVDVTGRVDDDTIAAANETDAKATINGICDERLRFLKGLKTWGVFGKGWARRVSEVRAAALAMAESHADADAENAPQSGGKAFADDVDQPDDAANPPQDAPKSLIKSKIAQAGAGAGLLGGTEIIGQANDAAEKVKTLKETATEIGVFDWLQHLVASPRFLIGVAIMVLAGLAIYWRWKDHGHGKSQ